MKKKNLFLILLSALMLTLLTSNAVALVTPIDLNDFYSNGLVWTNSDGSVAAIAGEGYLSNDPFAGDPGIPISENALSLSFDYLFIEPFRQDIEFFAWLYDGVSGATIDEFSAQNSSFGNVTFDLTGVDPATTLLGLDFSVTALSGLHNWALTVIGNTRLNSSDPAAAPVPEPATMLLLGAGLVGLAGLGRKKLLTR